MNVERMSHRLMHHSLDTYIQDKNSLNQVLFPKTAKVLLLVLSLLLPESSFQFLKDISRSLRGEIFETDRERERKRERERETLRAS